MHTSTTLPNEDRGQSLAGCSEEQSHHGGHDDSLSPMESADQAAGTFVNPSSIRPRDPASAGTADCPEWQNRGGAEATCPAEHQQGNSQDHAGRLPRSAIQSALAGLRLHNNANECWLNATVQAWLWTTSSCSEQYATQVRRLLMSPQAGGVSLAEHGFNPESWGNAQQQDSGEFADSLLMQIRSPLFNHAWESRISTAGGPETLLASQGTGPIILPLGNASNIDLQELLDAWQSAENRVTAFTEASPCRVFQLDRTMYDNRGRPFKAPASVWLPTAVLIPTFVDGTVYELAPYLPVAMVLHKGNTRAGHFQAALRAGPHFWLETDDGRIAGPNGSLPDAGAADMVQLWLVRTDRHAFTDLVPNPTRDPRDMMRDHAYREVRTHPVYQHLLRCLCMQCGQWIFSYEDHERHLDQCHPDTKKPQKDYERMLAELEHTPCRWCLAWEVETHQCQALWQALVVQDLEDTDPPFDLMPPGAMAAHLRLRATDPVPERASTRSQPTQSHREPDREPSPVPDSPVPLLSALEELATPITSSPPDAALWACLRRALNYSPQDEEDADGNGASDTSEASS